MTNEINIESHEPVYEVTAICEAPKDGIKQHSDSSLAVKIKRLHKSAVIPSYARDGDAGLDLTAVSCYLDSDGNIVYGFGLAFEIPAGYVGLVFPRSSLSRYNLDMSNAVGVVDSGYRGEVTAKFKPSLSFGREDATKIYNVGDRVAQLIILPYPRIKFVETDELSPSERDTNSYGSTGR